MNVTKNGVHGVISLNRLVDSWVWRSLILIFFLVLIFFISPLIIAFFLRWLIFLIFFFITLSLFLGKRSETEEQTGVKTTRTGMSREIRGVMEGWLREQERR